MGALVLGALAGILALVASAGDRPPASGDAGGVPGDKSPGKGARKASRRMSAQEAFLEGKKARDSELTAEATAKAAREAEIDQAIAAREKAAAKADKGATA